MKYFLLILSLIFGSQILLANTFPLAEENLKQNNFEIFTSKNQTVILYDKNGSSLDSISAYLLADDIFKITNYKPEIVTRIKQANGNVIVIGNIHSKFIAFFLNKKDIKTEFENQWEAGTIKAVSYDTNGRIISEASKTTIKLVGDHIEKDAFDKIVEVDTTKELDLYKDKNATDTKGQLRIVKLNFMKTHDEHIEHII